MQFKISINFRNTHILPSMQNYQIIKIRSNINQYQISQPMPSQSHSVLKECLMQEYDQNANIDDLRNRQEYQNEWHGYPCQDLHRKLSNLQKTLLRDSSFRSMHLSKQNSSVFEPYDSGSVNLEQHLQKLGPKLPSHYYDKIMNLINNYEKVEMLRRGQEKEIAELESKKKKYRELGPQLDKEIEAETLRIKKIQIKSQLWDERFQVSRKHRVFLFGL